MPTPIDIDAVKQRVCAEVDRRAELLVDASRQIHARPELGFEERFAHDLLTGIIEREGLEPERGAYGLETAFATRVGDGGPAIAVLCEYDALPGLGHACGHNIIGTAGLGAGLSLAALANEVGGQVVILGTPAEEGGGGKQLMADQGAFDGVEAAMMVHPAGLDLTSMHTLAAQQLYATFEGRAAHASAFPHEGRNALDAAVLGYVGVAALRQHIRATERVHGIFTKAGDKPNIVPAEAESYWFVRSDDLRSLDALRSRVVACLQAGADAAGCRMTIRWVEPVYADLVHNDPIGERYVANAARLGRTVVDHRTVDGVVGSTDMGNISHLVPSIHPIIAVSPADVPIHSAAFARWAGSEEGDRAVVDGAKALAMTVIDLWLLPDVLAAARADFDRSAGRLASTGDGPPPP
ncbi:MAG: M20 family metallopeptidase [Acidimicrobiales bacterium]